MTTVQHVPSFTVNQKLAMTTNRYEVIGPDGALLAVAQQKRLALKEKVTFYTDESRRQEAFTFGARNVMDLRGAYDVVAADGSPIGTFRKQFGASLMRTTFTLEGDGFVGTGQERSQLVAVLRRFTDLPFLTMHFDVVDDATGQPLLSVERAASVRDRYAVSVPDPRVDVRLAAAFAVGMDALLGR
ncbi:MAG: hypothetical protein NTV28_14875 [Propionibacteriales bacterium]|nr:hypothetical protein [Propionibacteriales bacterium]